MAQSPLSFRHDGLPGNSGPREGVSGTAGDPGADTLDVQAPGRRSLQTRQDLEELLAQQTRVGQRDRVVTGEAGCTQPLAGLPRRLDHRVLVEVAQAVGADAGADLLDLEAGGDQLGPGGEVDAVEAGPLHRRAGDANVDLGRPGLAQHPDLGALGVDTHDRVVDDHQALAADDSLERVELQPDAELAQRLAGLDESPPDVGVLDEALTVRDAAGPGVADRRRRARLWHRDDQVGINRVLHGQPPTHLDPGL